VIDFGGAWEGRGDTHVGVGKGQGKWIGFPGEGLWRMVTFVWRGTRDSPQILTEWARRGGDFGGSRIRRHYSKDVHGKLF